MIFVFLWALLSLFFLCGALVERYYLSTFIDLTDYAIGDDYLIADFSVWDDKNMWADLAGGRTVPRFLWCFEHDSPVHSTEPSHMGLLVCEVERHGVMSGEDCDIDEANSPSRVEECVHERSEWCERAAEHPKVVAS